MWLSSKTASPLGTMPESLQENLKSDELMAYQAVVHHIDVFKDHK
jgi:hypothetical protein